VSNKATTLARANLMVALCRLNNIPARLVSGFILQENKYQKPYYWVEVYDETKNWWKKEMVTTKKSCQMWEQITYK